MSTVVCWFKRTLKQLEREQTDRWTDGQTNRQTDRQTDTHDDYRNPLAHARRGLTTLTLAHARRGLIMCTHCMPYNNNITHRNEKSTQHTSTSLKLSMLVVRTSKPGTSLVQTMFAKFKLVRQACVKLA